MKNSLEKMRKNLARLLFLVSSIIVFSAILMILWIFEILSREIISIVIIPESWVKSSID